MSIDGSSELTPVTDSAAEADSDPAWSADGTSIAFRRRVGPPRGEKFNGDNRLEDTDILTVAATGGPVRTLVRGSATDGKPSWSPDGRTIAFISNRDADGSRTETKDIWLVSAEGGQPTPLGLKLRATPHRRGRPVDQSSSRMMVPSMSTTTRRRGLLPT